MKCIVSIEEATPVAFVDVYEEGDKWVKLQGCDKCSLTIRRECCGSCSYLTDDGLCLYQIEQGKELLDGEPSKSHKPFWCVIFRKPTRQKKGCALIYKCVRGSNKGKIRSVCDPAGVFS